MTRFIEAMDAVSRRLEARAAVIRAEAKNRSALYRAFCAGAVAGIKSYSEARGRFDQDTVWKEVNDAAHRHSTNHETAKEET